MLQIDGKLLHGIVGDFDICTTTMNAIARLHHQLDDEMYARWSEKIWRRFCEWTLRYVLTILNFVYEQVFIFMYPVKK
jgi:hypothetical protein